MECSKCATRERKEKEAGWQMSAGLQMADIPKRTQKIWE
jgi:hypothetical protein